MHVLSIWKMLHIHLLAAVDLRQKLTKQKVARKMQERHSSPYDNTHIMGTMRRHLNNRRVEIDHRGVLTVTSETRSNTCENDRSAEESRRPTRCDIEEGLRMSKRSIINVPTTRRPPKGSTRPSRLNERPYNRHMAMQM